MNALMVRNVGFSYSEGAVFSGLDFAVESGEMVGLIGPNGAGKTTLLRLLSGGLRATSGQVEVGHEKIASLSHRARARLIGVVPQESSMTFDFTVMETVLMGRTPYLGLLGVEGPEDIAAASEALARTGMDRFSHRLLSHLSGGERQLVLIARALAQEPRILLLDEPSAFLDIRHRLQIYSLLQRLNEEKGLTLVTTSHDINLAARFCRRIVLIKGGRIVADGSPAEVFRADILSDVYETPLEITSDPSSGAPYAIPSATGHLS